MSSYRQILYHIIFRTKNGKSSLTLEHTKELYTFKPFLRKMLAKPKNQPRSVQKLSGSDQLLKVVQLPSPRE